MPMHRIESGPTEDDLDVLEAAVKKIEKAGEEIVHCAPNWLGFPVGEWVIFTRKAPGGRPRTVEKRSQ